MTMVSWKKPLLLAILLSVLGFGAYWLEFKHKPKKESAEESSKKLFALPEEAQVQSIKIAGTHQTFLLKCLGLQQKQCKLGANGQWELIEPLKTKGDASNAASLLSAAGHLAFADSIDLASETPEKRQRLLEEYGLDSKSRGAKTARSLALSYQSGSEAPQTLAVYLGQTHPIGDNVYALLSQTQGEGADSKPNENRVYLIPGFFAANLDKDLTYWRDKRFTEWSSTDVESFEFQGSKGKLSAARKDASWELGIAGATFSGDPDRIEELLSAATYLTAKSFVAETQNDPKAKGILSRAKLILTLKLIKKGAEPATFRFFQTGSPSKPGQKLYVTSSLASPVFEIEVSALRPIDRAPKDLRYSKLLSSEDRFMIQKITFSGKSWGPGDFALLSKDGAWKVEGQPTFPLDTSKVQSLLDQLSGDRIKDYLPASSKIPGIEEGVTLKLGTAKNEDQARYLFWQHRDALYARSLKSRTGEILALDASLKKALPWKRADLEVHASPVPASAP